MANSAASAFLVTWLISILVKILILYLIGWGLWRAASFGISFFQTRVMTDLSNSCFGYLHRHSVSFFNNNFVGSLVKKVNRFSRSFLGVTDEFFFDILPLVVQVFGIIFILAAKNFILGLIVLFWVAVYCLINYYLSLYKLKFDLQRSELDSKVTGVLADTITNHQNVKLFNGYDREKSAFKNLLGVWQRLQYFCWNLSNIFEAVQTLLMIILEFGIFYLALSLWRKGIFTVGHFVLIQAYIINIFNRLWNFGKVIRHYYEYMADAQEMTEVLETPHEIQDVKNARELKVAQGSIEFKEVVFSYQQTRRVINRFNLTVKPQERLALVGPSGAGKSTLVNLLLRNYDLENGKILIDGQKIAIVTQESLWQNISLVPQDSILFHRSLMENIRYGRPQASDKEVIKAARLAYCHDFISSFSEGYNTYVGERGVKLSGGERQRVAIARAILKNAPILILDEATSSLDSGSEQLIQEALKTLMAGKTVIVIAHRLSTIMKMDRIVVLKEGRLVEEGSHQLFLKNKNSLYRLLWEKQIGGFIS